MRMLTTSFYLDKLNQAYNKRECDLHACVLITNSPAVWLATLVQALRSQPKVPIGCTGLRFFYLLPDIVVHVKKMLFERCGSWLFRKQSAFRKALQSLAVCIPVQLNNNQAPRSCRHAPRSCRKGAQFGSCCSSIFTSGSPYEI